MMSLLPTALFILLSFAIVLAEDYNVTELDTVDGLVLDVRRGS